MTVNSQPDVVAYWDRVWQDDIRRGDWQQPHPWVASIDLLLRHKGVRTVLDLGAGIGRHALFFAGLGYRVHALDAGAGGLELIRRRARADRLPVHIYQGRIEELPFRGQCVDYILCWDTLYHGLPQQVDRRLAEISRVLKPGGLFQGTLLSKANSRYGLGRQVAPDTYVLDHERDKAHPHLYCDKQDLARQLTGFRLISLDHLAYPSYPRAWHWLFFTQKT